MTPSPTHPTTTPLPETFGESYFRSGNYHNYLERAGSYHKLATELTHFLGQIRIHPSDGQVLDFGCGPGFFVDGLRQRDWIAFGYDISEWAVNHKSHPYLSNNRCWLRMWNCLAFALDVFEHIPKDRLAEEIQAVDTDKWLVRIPVCQQDGGKFILGTAEADATHVVRWTKLTWQRFFASIGYQEVVRINLNTIWDSSGVYVALLRRQTS